MKTLKKHLHKIQSWIKSNKQQALLLFAIIALAAFFRLWRIDEYLPFMGDEGRDVRVVRRFVTELDPMFIGPRTSIGDMYLGPLYYYFIAPSLLLFNLSPVGPAVSVALTGVATVFFVWYVGNKWFGKWAGLTASLLFAISPTVISLSKHSWNPNIMPFLSLFSIYAVWQVRKGESLKWLLALAISLAFVIQSHYLGLLLFPTVGFIWFISFLTTKEKRAFIKMSAFAALIFILLMSPLFIFDSKHDWHNTQSMLKFFTERQTTVSAKPWSAIPALWPLWTTKVVGDLVAATNQKISFITATSVLLGMAILKFKNLKKFTTALLKVNKYTPHTLLVLWLVIGLLGLGSLKQNVYSHYLGFLFPVPFLLIGALFEEVRNKKLLVIPALALLGVLVWMNLAKNPLLHPPQRQLQRVQEVDKKIIEESMGKPFNFGLVADRNYEEGYLYFFELWDSPVKIVDPQHADTKTDQLFVVCENPKCESPIYSPKAEIAHFGPSRVESEWEVGGFKLYKLVQAE